ncbi:hypothetical protein [Xanthobacter autotrophicus]|uniref:hypothetical protein n=1 Tax=Xanthobacter autotrophicus TaxID=280 RepID=UPI0024A6CD48|nr:hypothetical protein [Xanthobacter autotrophicus]MDI4655355.1 hypothetical protein [Xanthobacter autotrophicus]
MATLKNVLLLFSAVIFVLVSAAERTYAQSSSGLDLLDEYKAQYTTYFNKLKPDVVPLYGRSSNYRVGDIWDSSMTRLLDGADRCFPGLAIRVNEDSLGTITLKRDASLGFLLRVRRLLSASPSGETESTVSIGFTDVTEERLLEADLARSLNQAACPLAIPIVRHEIINQTEIIPVIIGRLYRGKRRITITYADKASAEAKLSELTALATTGVAADIGIKTAFGLERSIVVVDNRTVPLAFAPALIPVLAASVLQGEANVDEVQYQWTPFDPAQQPSQTGVLSDLNTAIADRTWSWADEKSDP